MKPKPLAALKSELKYHRTIEENHQAIADTLELCVLCQETKRVKECQDTCRNIAGQR